MPVEIDNVIHQVYVLKRPYVDEFLCRMGELFECVLFTASLAKVRITRIYILQGQVGGLDPKLPNSDTGNLKFSVSCISVDVVKQQQDKLDLIAKDFNPICLLLFSSTPTPWQIFLTNGMSSIVVSSANPACSIGAIMSRTSVG